MRKLFLISLIIFLPALVNAGYITEYTVYNYKTLQPVPLANLTAYNDTWENSVLTDTDGYGALSLNGSFTITITRSMYAEYSDTVNITNDSATDIMLSPYSHAGIVKITIADMTLAGNHVSCFYFDNNRQEGCYNSSNTEIILHNNMNYTWQPIVGKSDIIGSPTSMIKYSLLYYGSLLGVMVFALMAAFMLYAVVKIIFRK